MPTKRDVLNHFIRSELQELATRFDLEVGDRRSKEALVDAAASSRKVLLEPVLGDMSRERLKALCRALDLDDGGREKAALIERLLGSKTNGPTPDAPAGRASRTSATGVAPEIVPGAKLTIDALERYLWSAADILRGSIDSSDYKGFIFGLLFLKRLSDRFEEECEALVADGDDPEDRDNHQFFVPKRARWAEIQRTATNIGETLNKAAAALEGSNASLEGVLAGIDFNDERKLGDARNRDVVLGRLVQHFSKITLKNANLSEPDMLGRAYEYLIEKFADDAGKKGGEFYTPKKVVELIVEILAPTEGMRVCDPTCGSGGMLIESAHYLARRGKNPKNLSLSGQEKNLGTWAICKMNTLLHGLPDARIEKGDTIRDPKLREGGELMLFDRVIANPPFSLDEWGREVAENDPYGRFRFGVPPKTKGDLAFVQHMIATATRSTPSSRPSRSTTPSCRCFGATLGSRASTRRCRSTPSRPVSRGSTRALGSAPSSTDCGRCCGPSPSSARPSSALGVRPRRRWRTSAPGTSPTFVLRDTSTPTTHFGRPSLPLKTTTSWSTSGRGGSSWACTSPCRVVGGVGTCRSCRSTILRGVRST